MPFSRGFLAIFVVLGCLRPGLAAEPAARELVPADTLLLIEVNHPLELIENPLARDIWERIQGTHGVQQALASPQVEKFRQAARFIEKSLGLDWKTGLSRLTEGGIVFAVQPQKPDSEPVVTAVVTAADEQVLKAFIDAAQAEIRRQAGSSSNEAGQTGANQPEAGKSPDPESTEYRSFACHRVGNGRFSVIGRRLIVSNSQAGLKAALDRQAGAAPEKGFDPPASLRLASSTGAAPIIQATVNLKRLREDPKAEKALTLPANDLIPVVLLGGYLDLLRRADFGAAALFVDGPAYELKLRVPVGSEGTFPGLRGYFASETTDAALPLLKPAGTIFSASWFRDYKRLWDARKELFDADLVKQIEQGDAKARSDGAHIGPSDLVALLGPHFRVITARSREIVYKIKLEERLPAFALVASVRDEAAFRQRVLTPIDGLLLFLISANQGEVKSADYRDAKITTIRFPERSEIAESEKRALYNFNPSYTLTRGQLLVGSTAEIVRDLIDELDRQGPPPAEARAERQTDRQELSLAGLSEFFKGYQERLVRGAVLGQGLSPAEAENEIAIFHDLLKRLGSVTTSHTISGDHFEIRLRLGPGEMP
jgi:hypothetical protein